MNIKWLAGFFDGEGCVCAASSTKRFSLIVSISQKQVAILKEIRKKYGGYLQKRACPILQMSHVEAANFLKALLPHLILKKKIAKLGLKLHSIQGSELKMKSNKRRYYKWVNNKKAAVARKMSKLNHKD